MIPLPPLHPAALAPFTLILLVLAGLALGYFIYVRLFAAPAVHRDRGRRAPEPPPSANIGMSQIKPEAPSTTGAAAQHGKAPIDDTNSDIAHRDRKYLSQAAEHFAAARNWGYQLQNLDVDEAAASPFDVLVIDYALDGDDASALSPKDIARLKKQPDGGRRICLAYLSIGEAESYRSYWQESWERRAPDWLLGENTDWEENYSVRFWRPEWQELIFGNRAALLDKIIEQGFDGVYLDKCDIFEDLAEDYPKIAQERQDMESDLLGFIDRLAAYARARRPEFLVVMQNAESLLNDDGLRATLDGAAKEELIFGQDGGEDRNDADEFDCSREQLQLLRAEGKPVFVVEYLSSKNKIAEAQRIAADLGFVLAISDPSRDLDELGRDPGQEVASV